MLLGAILLLGFAAAVLAPIVVRIARGWSGWILALVPAAIAGLVVARSPGVTGGPGPREELAWASDLGLCVALRLDGLAALFALLVAGVGALVLIYAGAYLKGHAHLGRFFALLLLFLSAMLGIVLADDLLTLYVFWELTTVSSWLLIGFEHEKKEARRAAWQALMVTASGGLAMLVAFVLSASATGSYSISEMLSGPGGVKESGLYPVILGLVVFGAATKSALVPLHFWLPNAMAAPTPVSAFLHSAAMVKAGIYVLLRLGPILGDTPEWSVTLTSLGALTAIVAAWLAFIQKDLKRLLAYTTISALGTMTLAIGVGGAHGTRVALLLVFAHALYKGALFMVAGAIDHGTGTRDLTAIGGLLRALPWTAIGSVLATVSMIGIVPTLGFIAEEALLELLASPTAITGYLSLAAVIAYLTLYRATGLVAGVRPFLGQERAPHAPHEGTSGLWIPPIVLGIAGVALALFPSSIGSWLVDPATESAARELPPKPISLWHGFTTAFLLGVATLVAGAALSLAWRAVRELAGRIASVGRAGPTRIYELLDRGLQATAKRLDRFLQHGYLPRYILIALATIVLVSARPLIEAEVSWPLNRSPLRVFDIMIAALALASALAAAMGNSRLLVITSMSMVGYSVALVFAIYGGPDLAITQLLVETLLTVVAVILFSVLPQFKELSGPGARARDALLSCVVGSIVAMLLLIATGARSDAEVATYYVGNSADLAHSPNIVNAILVNFRAGDTFGEILVLAAAALGAASLFVVRDRRAARKGIARTESTMGRATERWPYSIVLAASLKILLPLLMTFAISLLVAGHHAPGGGFAAALVFAASLVLFLFGAPGAAERELVWLRPRTLLVSGLLLVIASGAFALFSGGAFLAERSFDWKIEALGGLRLGTAFLFDVGVCLVSAGALFLLLQVLEAHGPWRR